MLNMIDKETNIQLAKKDLIDAKCTKGGKYSIIHYLRLFVSQINTYPEYYNQVQTANNVIKKLQTKGSRVNKDVLNIINSIEM